MSRTDDEGRMALWCIHNLDKAAGEIERLRKGIQDFLDGNYPHPRSYRAQGPQSQCPHGHYYYEDCNSCDSEHFSRLLGETYTLRQGEQK